MPGFNQQGPNGEGEMTGRQRGMCQRTEDRPFPRMRDGSEGGRGMGRGQGPGRGQGSGRGPGFGRGQGPGRGPGFEREAGDMQDSARQYEVEEVDNVATLKKQHQAAQEMVTAIEKKIKDLESGK